MSKWRVTVPQTEIELDAEDEGEALCDASDLFNFMNVAIAEEIESDDAEEQ